MQARKRVCLDVFFRNEPVVQLVGQYFRRDRGAAPLRAGYQYLTKRARLLYNGGEAVWPWLPDRSPLTRMCCGGFSCSHDRRQNANSVALSICMDDRYGRRVVRYR